MTITGTIEQAPNNAYLYTDVLTGDFIFRSIQSNNFMFGFNCNRPSAFSVQPAGTYVNADPSTYQTANLYLNCTNTSNTALTTNQVIGNVNFSGNYASSTNSACNVMAAVSSVYTGTGTTKGGALTFSTASNTGLAERMRVSASGNVGIGSTVPAYTLDVNGTMRNTGTALFSSNLTVSGQSTFSNAVSVLGGVTMMGTSSTSAQVFNMTDGTTVNGVSKTYKLGYVTGGGSIVVKGHIGYILEPEEFTATLKFNGSIQSGTLVLHTNMGNASFSPWRNNQITFYSVTDSAGNIHIYMKNSAGYITSTFNVSCCQYNGTFKLYQNKPIAGLTTWTAADFKANDTDIGASYSNAVSIPATSFTWLSVYDGQTGNVGIGTTNPQYRLDVVGGGIHTTNNIVVGSNTYAANSQDALHVFVPAIGGYSSNDFAITSGWGGYYDVCGIAWNSYNIANNYYGRYNNTRLGWSLLTGGNALVFSCYGAGYTGSNIPQGVCYTPLGIGSNYITTPMLGVNTTPAYTLDVNGTARVQNTLILDATSTLNQPGLTLKGGSGTNYRAQRIDYYGSAAASSIPQWSFIGDYNQNNTNDLRFVNNTGSYPLTLLQSGNVGINTITPSYTLDVNGTVRFTGSQLYLNNGNYFIDNSSSGGGQTIVGYNTQKSSTTGYSVIQVFNNSTDRSILMCCQSAGATGGTNGVGIFTESPAYPLDVNGTTRTSKIIISPSSTWGDGIMFNSGDSHIWDSTGSPNGLIFHTHTSSNFTWMTTGGIDRMTLVGSTGYLGIGTSPAYPLDVNGQVRGNVMISQTTSSGTGALKVATTTNSTDNWWIGFAQGGYTDAQDRARIGVEIKPGGPGQLFFTTGYGGAQTEQMRIMDTGLVGIGTNNPGYKLDVNGTINATGYNNLLINSYNDGSTNKAPTCAALQSVFSIVRTDLFYTSYFTTNDAITSVSKTVSIMNLSSGTQDITFTANPSDYPEGFEATIINSGNNYTFFFNNNSAGGASWWIPMSDMGTWTTPTHGKGGCANNNYCYIRKVMKGSAHAWLIYGPGAAII